MSFKEFLKEEKIKFNADNWSGKSDEVVIDDKKMTFRSKSWTGKFKKVKEDMVKVIFDDYEHAPINVHLYKGEWEAEMDGISRSDKNPIVAAIKLANNMF